MTSERAGFELPLLLAGAFRILIDQLHTELAQQGHPDARPIHGFALQAVEPEGVTISELGRRLGVTKQAAAKTASGLEALGYVARDLHPHDSRAWIISRTPRGNDFLARSAQIFDRLRQDWVSQLGDARLESMEDDLRTVVAQAGGAKLGDLPGWLH